MPVATPGTPVRSRMSEENFGNPMCPGTLLGSHRDLPRFALRNASGKAPADSADFSFQVPDSCLAGVFPDDPLDRRPGNVNSLRVEPVLLDLPGNKKFPRDLHLFFLGVAREFQNLHAVQQRTGNGVQLVGRGDEHDLGQIKLHFQVMVGKREVLLRVKHLQQVPKTGLPENHCRSCPLHRA